MVERMWNTFSEITGHLEWKILMWLGHLEKEEYKKCKIQWQNINILHKNKRTQMMIDMCRMNTTPDWLDWEKWLSHYLSMLQIKKKNNNNNIKRMKSFFVSVYRLLYYFEENCRVYRDLNWARKLYTIWYHNLCKTFLLYMDKIWQFSSGGRGDEMKENSELGLVELSQLRYEWQIYA